MVEKKNISLNNKKEEKKNKNKESVSKSKSRLAVKSDFAPIGAGAKSQNLPAAINLRDDKKYQLIQSIKSKKELSGLDDDFITLKVDKIFGADHTLKKKFDAAKDFSQFCRSKEYESLLKRIRKELRAIYGVFQQEGSNRDGLLKKLRITTDQNEKNRIITSILGSHTSTKERLPYYDEIYSKLCSEIKPKIVIDLGCGMNPLAYSYFVKYNCTPKIIASDISKDDMQFLTQCFTTTQIPGKAIALDLTKDADIEKLRDLKGDVTLLLKLLDSLEEARRHISYKIFDAITTPWIIASFPTKSLGGKKNIARAGRTWFERLLGRKEMTWETFSCENELFYVIKRK